MTCRGGLVVAIVLCVALPAHADRDRARSDYKKGMAAFVLEHWDEAIALFEQGFQEEPEPAFIYNIAQAHARAHRPDKAISFYQKYLELMPNAEDRATVEASIHALEAQLHPPAPPPEEKPAPVVAQPSAPLVVERPLPPARPRKKWPIAVGVVIGVLAAGGIAAGLAVALSHSAKEPVLPLESAR